MANEQGRAHVENQRLRRWLVASRYGSSSCAGVSPLVTGMIEGENHVWHLTVAAYGPCSQSRIPWDGSANWVVHSI